MDKAVLLDALVKTRISLAEGYFRDITRMVVDKNIPLDVVKKLQNERDEVLAEFTQRIDRLREEIAK